MKKTFVSNNGFLKLENMDWFNHKVKPRIEYDFLIRCHMA